MRKHSTIKIAAVALLAGVGGAAALSGPAFAGFDEANMYSFMEGGSAPAQAAPAPSYAAPSQAVPDGARAYYQGSGEQTHRSRHEGHAHRYDIQP